MTKDELTKSEIDLIIAIAERAEKLNLLMFDRLSLIMDLTATHKEFELRLEALLKADDSNFSHDIVGIQNNLDRRTKKMQNCFLPRYAS